MQMLQLLLLLLLLFWDFRAARFWEGKAGVCGAAGMVWKVMMCWTPVHRSLYLVLHTCTYAAVPPFNFYTAMHLVRCDGVSEATLSF